MTAVFWPSLLNGLPVATAVFLFLHFRLRIACPPPCPRGWRWLSSLPAALFPLTLAAGLLARPSLSPLLRGAGSAWLRWMSLLLLAAMVETALSHFFPNARRLWVLGTMAASLLALPLLHAFSPRFYPFAMFCRESKVVLAVALVHGFVLLRLNRGLPVPDRFRPWLALSCWLGGGWFALHSTTYGSSPGPGGSVAPGSASCSCSGWPCCSRRFSPPCSPGAVGSGPGSP